MRRRANGRAAAVILAGLGLWSGVLPTLAADGYYTAWIAPTGPRGWWQMSEGAAPFAGSTGGEVGSGYIANNGNAGLSTVADGPTGTPATHSRAADLTFDVGASQHGGRWALGVWSRLAKSGLGSQPAIITSGRYQQTGARAFLRLTGGYYELGIEGGGTTRLLNGGTSKGAATPGDWHYLVVVVNSSPTATECGYEPGGCFHGYAHLWVDGYLYLTLSGADAAGLGVLDLGGTWNGGSPDDGYVGDFYGATIWTGDTADGLEQGWGGCAAGNPWNAPLLSAPCQFAITRQWAAGTNLPPPCASDPRLQCGSNGIPQPGSGAIPGQPAPLSGSTGKPLVNPLALDQCAAPGWTDPSGWVPYLACQIGDAVKSAANQLILVANVVIDLLVPDTGGIWSTLGGVRDDLMGRVPFSYVAAELAGLSQALAAPPQPVVLHLPESTYGPGLDIDFAVQLAPLAQPVLGGVSGRDLLGAAFCVGIGLRLIHATRRDLAGNPE